MVASQNVPISIKTLMIYICSFYSCLYSLALDTKAASNGCKDTLEEKRVRHLLLNEYYMHHSIVGTFD